MIKTVLLVILVIFLLTSGVAAISLYYQPGLSVWEVLLVIAAALAGVGAFSWTLIRGLNALLEGLERAKSLIEKESLNIDKKIARDVLGQLSDYGLGDVKIERVDGYLMREYSEFSKEGRELIIKELTKCGYIEISSGVVRVTRSGKKFSKRR